MMKHYAPERQWAAALVRRELDLWQDEQPVPEVFQSAVMGAGVRPRPRFRGQIHVNLHAPEDVTTPDALTATPGPVVTAFEITKCCEAQRDALRAQALRHDAARA